MSTPPNSAWPDPKGFPFNLFGGGGAGAPANPLAQGMTSSVDLMRKMMGQFPGGTAVPGFLLPTVDVEELDKRISDLRAAESWLEVNLGMLRATIQGLEVQRNTVAAIQSLGAMSGTLTPAKGAAPSTGGLPPGWPAPAQAPAPAPVASAPPPEPEPVVEPEPEPEPEAPAAAEPASAPPVAAAIGQLAATRWLEVLQDQFSRVAQAALAGQPAAPAPAAKSSAATPPVRKVATKKKAAKRAAATRKSRGAA